MERDMLAAIQAIGHKMQDPNNPNWEQRLYEVARDLYVKSIGNSDSIEEVASEAIEKAKVFITLLRKETENK